MRAANAIVRNASRWLLAGAAIGACALSGAANAAPRAPRPPAPRLTEETPPGWDLPWLSKPAVPPAPIDRRWLSAYPLTRPRTYTGANTEYVLMPIGGIGTGSIWLDGQGRLAVWQIFNNANENRIPDSFFAIRAQAAGGPAVTRVLQTVPEAGFQPMESLEYEGGYPIARLSFRDKALPVEVRLQAFNPMIPTDTANSSLPCAIFRISAHNPGKAPVQVNVLGSLQNAVGSGGAAGIDGVKFAGYGGNNINLKCEPDVAALVMERNPGGLVPGLLKVRRTRSAPVAEPELLWVERLGSPAEMAEQGARGTQAIEAMARLSREGGVIVVSSATEGFFQSLADVQKKMGRWSELEVFEDFEKGGYPGWTVKGEAFGSKPAGGTLANQQVVSGFLGKGLVNTFIAGDAPQGELISKPFPIRKRYIGFLIGGGHFAGETCMNLRVDGKVVRTAVGKDNERLEAAQWDVAEFQGKEGVLEIIDHASGGWGHVNVDQIVFSNTPPDALMRLDGAVESIATQFELRFTGATSEMLPSGAKITVTDPQAKALPGSWSLGRCVRLAGLDPAASGFKVLAASGDAPLLLSGKLGKATLILSLGDVLPYSWVKGLLLQARGKPLAAGERLVPAAPGWGSMALATPRTDAVCSQWIDGAKLAADFARDGGFKDSVTANESPDGQTINGAISWPLTVPPGEERTATFVVSWYFPSVDRFAHSGNLCCRRFGDAYEVARYVCQHAGPLWERTLLYHDTLYQSNLPEEFLDAMSSQSVIFRGPTAWWSEDGYFAGYEGAYGCCPLNCTHVWNYAQSHARLFPEIGRNMRESDLLVYLHPDGETSHRQHSANSAFIDGHAATIEGAYREYQLSPDLAFLKRVWPNLKKTVDWMVERIDADHDGVPAGRQPNTYDCDVSGANTFIGSQYLSALAAGERMALVMKEPETAARWRAIREAGMRNQDQRLWNGEYYIQIPDPKPANDYNTGCHSDQLLGQWWAHQLNLGYLYPKEHVRAALQAVMAHNFREKFAGFQQRPRRYIPDDEGGLLICTWPNGGRPNPFTIYSDEVWTGIEYAAAGAMMQEGMVAQARQIVKTARGRYDGRKREGLNSGPGGNPFNELECGKFYARAMSSWGLLLASQGQILEGPAGILGFKPTWQPENHRSFFTAPEGWGLFVQTRQANRQRERIEMRHGHFGLRELVFAVPEAAGRMTPAVTVSGKPVPATLSREGEEVRLRLDKRVEVPEGAVVAVTLGWGE